MMDGRYMEKVFAKMNHEFRSEVRRIDRKLSEIQWSDRIGTSYAQLDRDKVICEVRCVVFTIGEIDTVTQQFEADMFLSFRWKKTAFDHSQNGKYWSPCVKFVNAVAIEETWCKSDTDLGGEYVYLYITVKGTFKISMKLNRFPFDYQELTISVTSSWPVEKLKFQRTMTTDNKIIDYINTDTFTGKHEWNLQEDIISEKEPTDSTPECSDPAKIERPNLSKVYPKYHIKLQAQRRPLYYIWNVVFPTFCILALSFTSFVIEADAPSQRLGVTVTMLLTAVAFKSVVSSMLPRISYLTILDIYVMCSFVLQCLMVVQNAVAAVCAKYRKCKHFDVWSTVVLASIAIVVNIAFFITGIVLYIKVKRKLGRSSKIFKNKSAPLVTKQPKSAKLESQCPSHTTTEANLSSTSSEESEGPPPVEPLLPSKDSKV